MPTIASNSLPLGLSASPFALPDVVTGKTITLEDFKDAKGLVICFLCVHCPAVVHMRERFVAIAKSFSQQGIAFVAISANDVTAYPEDSPEKLQEMARVCGFDFPLLYDESQEVAQAYQAVCTPDIYVFDEKWGLYYRGRMDASTHKNGLPSTGEDLCHALECLLAGNQPPTPQHPGVGCSIKWK